MKKTVSIILALIFVLSACAVPAYAANDYVIVSPYEDVIWSGEGAWNAYKGNLHTHSTASDAEMDFSDMIKNHYNQGYDFLAMTDHGVTGKAWNEQPTQLALYVYQPIIGNNTTWLTDEEFEAITSGSYPDRTGAARGKGMTCVVGGNELNALTITKCHVNGMFLPEHVGDGYLGYENDHEGAVKLADEAGGISFINHPGDWLHSNSDISAVSDPQNVHYFSDILLKYDSCLGMEVFNERNSVTPYDRILWDNILMECLPYGKNVIAFSNNDAHVYDHIDTSFSVFMMEENTEESIKETMQSGAFFCVTRKLRSCEKLGPVEDINAVNSGLAYPEFTQLTVDGHKVTVKAKNCSNIQWVANGNVIASKDIAQSENESEYVLDLDTIAGAEDFLYIRCQLLGDGGCTLSQAPVIDDGTEPLVYEVDETSYAAQITKLINELLSTRIFVLLKMLFEEIFG